MFELIPFGHKANGLFDYFDQMVNDSFFGDTDQAFVPARTDILDKGDKYVLKADIPGFNKEDISIDIEGNRLTLTAEHKEEVKEDKNNYIRRERRYGAFARSFDIQGIDASQISASYQSGVLELDLPKVVETKPASHKIDIK
jgi:HSP20 family protein